MRAWLTRCDREGHGYIIAWKTSDYDDWGVIKDMISSLPSADRRYLSDVRAWWVSDRGWRSIASLFQTRPRPITTAGPVPDERTKAAFDRLHLLITAPPDGVKAIYRAYSLKAHPDTGGTHEKMRQLNADRDAALAWAERFNA